MKIALNNIAKPLVNIASIGAVLAVFSELWFYRVDADTLSVWLFLFYGIFGYVFIWAIRHFQIRGFAGFFIGAALFGFLIEGIVVNVLYETIPFSIFWTSLAWHALLSVSVGYYLYRRIMAAGSLRHALLLNSAIGLFLGLWNAYMWNVVENSDSAAVFFNWGDPTIFAGQFLLGYVIFILGHLGFDWLGSQQNRGHKIAYLLCALLLLTSYILGPLITIFPLSLLLPVLVVLSLLALKSGTRAAETPWLEHFENLRIPRLRYSASLLIPIGALAGYFSLYWSRVNFEANVAVVIICIPISALLWGISLVRLFRQRDKNPEVG